MSSTRNHITKVRFVNTELWNGVRGAAFSARADAGDSDTQNVIGIRFGIAVPVVSQRAECAPFERLTTQSLNAFPLTGAENENPESHGLHSHLGGSCVGLGTLAPSVTTNQEVARSSRAGRTTFASLKVKGQKAKVKGEVLGALRLRVDLAG